MLRLVKDWSHEWLLHPFWSSASPAKGPTWRHFGSRVVQVWPKYRLKRSLLAKRGTWPKPYYLDGFCAVWVDLGRYQAARGTGFFPNRPGFFLTDTGFFLTKGTFGRTFPNAARPSGQGLGPCGLRGWPWIPRRLLLLSYELLSNLIGMVCEGTKGRAATSSDVQNLLSACKQNPIVHAHFVRTLATDRPAGTTSLAA